MKSSEMYSDFDEMVDRILKNPEFEPIIIDERAEKFWDINRQVDHYPIEMEPDKVYGRYIPAVIGQGLNNDDYQIQDLLNPTFNVSLIDFLDMDDKGLLPIETTRTLISKIKEKAFLAALILSIALALVASYYAISYLIFGNVPDQFHSRFF